MRSAFDREVDQRAEQQVKQILSQQMSKYEGKQMMCRKWTFDDFRGSKQNKTLKDFMN